MDATTRTFLGLTAGCAQCHDHKFDPIPTEDYYALLGVFNSTQISEYPLSSEAVVKEYQAREETLNLEKEALQEFRNSHRQKLVEVFAHQISRYIQAGWEIVGSSNADLEEEARSDSLDVEMLERWVKYLAGSPRDHPFLNRWDDFLGKGATSEHVRQLAEEVEALAISVIREKRKIDRENKIRTHGKTREEIGQTEMLSLERDRYFLWRDLASPAKFTSPAEFESGILLYGDEKVDRFLDGLWGEHLKMLLARIQRVEAAMPMLWRYNSRRLDAETLRDSMLYVAGKLDFESGGAPARLDEKENFRRTVYGFVSRRRLDTLLAGISSTRTIVALQSQSRSKERLKPSLHRSS